SPDEPEQVDGRDGEPATDQRAGLCLHRDHPGAAPVAAVHHVRRHAAHRGLREDTLFERLLLPLDGSRLAEAALPAAERLALAFGSTVTLLHVVERGARPTVHGERHFTDRAAADAYLAELIAALAGRGVLASAHVHDVPEGDVAASVAAHAAEVNADLVVLCTHGRGGVRGFLWGGIAQQVLRRGTTPVLLVRAAPGHTAPAPFPPGTVLSPVG